MTSTLDAPVYVVKKDSKWHEAKTKYRAAKTEFFKEIDKDFPHGGFAYYHAGWFGVNGDSEDYETYKEHLRKNPDRNGVHMFKKTSPLWKVYHEKLNKFDGHSDPFKSHDVFGLNNVKASQRIDDRWYYSVKNPDLIQDPDNEVEPIEYTEYLRIVMAAIEGSDAEKQK